MEYVKVGDTDIRVSKLCVGCMSFGKAGTMHDWTLDEKQSEKLVNKALELGINFFDTANCYSLGTSEEYLGRAIRKYAKREEVVLASKVYFNEGRLSKQAIRREIDGTLKTAFDKMQSTVEFLSSVDTEKETFTGADADMQLNTGRFDLYYLLAVQGEAVMNLLCSMDFEMWYTLGNANQTFYLTAVNNGVKSTKYLSANSFMSLIAAVNESLEAFIKAEFAELHLTPNVTAGLKRYRLLSDLDSSTLSSIDSVSLDELDYVELA